MKNTKNVARRQSVARPSTTAKAHTKRRRSTEPAAPVCSRCGRENSHGRDCRNADACKARRRELKKTGARA